MSQVIFVSQCRRDEIIADAALRQTQVVLTRHDDVGWQVQKSRFLGADEQGRRLFVALPSLGGGTGGFVPHCGELLGITFRRGHKKCLFNAKVTSIDDDTSVGLELRWPDELQELQRRAYQRACPPPGRQIEVRFWAGESDWPDGSPRVGVLEDISAGGARVRSNDPGDFAPGQSIRLSFALQSKGPELVIDAIFRHRESRTKGVCSLGFQFVGLETTQEGQAMLSRIARVVTDFQRAAGRRQQFLQSRGRGR